jgi:hypothetical protein
MTEDDSNKEEGGEGAKRKRRQSGGTGRPKSPQARAPGSKTPLERSVVNKGEVPRASQQDFVPPPPRSRPKWLVPSTAVMVIGIAILVSFLVNLGGTSSHTPTVPVVPTVTTNTGTTTSTTSTGSTTSTTTTTTARKPSGPTLVWTPREITVHRNGSFNVDSFPITDMPTGFEVGFYPNAGDNNFQAIGAGAIAAWTGSGKPSFNDCGNSVGSTVGVSNIPLNTRGQWICAQTATNLVARFRYDAVSSDGNSFTFFVIVDRPPSS